MYKKPLGKLLPIRVLVVLMVCRPMNFRDYLNIHWQALKTDILAGNYRPQSVLKVEIPKTGGGMRMLGIPTVIDRLLQQAISQWLSPKYEVGFSPNSYGLAGA